MKDKGGIKKGDRHEKTQGEILTNKKERAIKREKEKDGMQKRQRGRETEREKVKERPRERDRERAHTDKD